MKTARHLPFDQWPEAERQAWKHAMRPAGLFDDSGPAVHWRATTREHVRRHYGYWLRYCKEQGISLAPGIQSSDRVTPDAVLAYLAHLQTTVTMNTAAIYISRLYWAVCVMYSDHDWDWLKVLVQRLERQVTGPVVDKRPCLRDAGVLVNLGLALMAEIQLDTIGNLTGKALIRARSQYRDGLLIALLALRPLRKGTLAQIRVHRELQQVGDQWHLVFDGAQSKTGQPLEYVVPELLHPVIEVYLSRVRSLFPKATAHDAFWASNAGCPMTASGITKRVRLWTQRRLGIAISPHRFRDCAASTLANRAPKQVRVAAALLGHTRLETTERYYIQANTLAAGRQYQAVVSAIKRKGQRR